MKLNKCLLWFLGCTLLFTACNDRNEIDYDLNGVAFDSPVIVEKTLTSAKVSAFVRLQAGVRYTQAGFCYSIKQNPTIYDATLPVVDNPVITQEGGLTASLDELELNVKYYVRAYLSLYQGGVTYSPQIEVTVGKIFDYQPPTYVDYYINDIAWESRNVWNLANVHDPTVLKAADGYYYMYQTDASYGNAHEGHGHFHGRRSKNLIDWEYLGATMNEPPTWVAERLNSYRADAGLDPIAADQINYGYWAPVVRKVNDNLYRMYYSVVIDNLIDGVGTWGERAFIGLAETSNPASNVWEDKGFVVCSSSDKGLNWTRKSESDWDAYFRWNAIDPTYVITEGGEHWLIYGSWHSGFVALELNGTTGMPVADLPNPWGTLNEIEPYGKRIATRRMSSRWQGSEAPEIIYREGYYYLFMAYDGLDVAYNTRVVRSQTITGPYVGIDGTDITTAGGNALPIVTHPYKFEGDQGWVGISHCAIFEDGSDNWYYASQGRMPAGAHGNELSNAIMLGQIRSIRWTKEGWPLVMPQRYGAVPQVPITEDELVGNWEHIDLSYSFGNQKTSSKMKLERDGTISEGTWASGKWSYDEENQILTANGVELYLQRECDWEASPRRATIVYAGLTTAKTYWGKKVN
ncbi:MAG: arabinan endo-1,5-alpha-L-arabinosidase [Phocaeicola sp.]